MHPGSEIGPKHVSQRMVTKLPFLTVQFSRSFLLLTVMIMCVAESVYSCSCILNALGFDSFFTSMVAKLGSLKKQ